MAVALERLDVVAAPRLRNSNPLSALAAALRITQAAIEATQASTFGAQVMYPGVNMSHEPASWAMNLQPMLVQASQV